MFIIFSVIQALLRLLKIQHVVHSDTAKKEISHFIRKWWERMSSSSNSGMSGSVQIPDDCTFGVPTLRTVIEIMNDLLAEVPSCIVVYSEIISIIEPHDLHFLIPYITSTDYRTSIATMNLVMRLLETETVSNT